MARQFARTFLPWVLASSAASLACGGNEFSARGGGSSGAPQGGSGAGEGPGGAGGASAGSGGLPSGGQGGAGAAGGTATGGSGGSAGTGTAGSAGAGSDPDGGVGGSGCTSIRDCDAGTYCRPGIGQCVSCGDFSRVGFGPPERVEAVSDAAANVRFPRATHNAAELFFRAGGSAEQTLLWHAPDMNAASGLAPFGATVNAENESTSGPLEMLVSLGSLGSYNLFFDRTSGNQRDLYGAVRSGSNVSGVERLPAPLNAPEIALTPHHNWHMAIAGGLQRAYWMTNRNGVEQLVTIAAGSLQDLVPSIVNITIASTSNCTRKGDDATPWVTPDGEFLFFRSLEMDATTCLAAGDAHDLYLVPLGSDGLPSASGARIAAPSTPGWDDTDPSLSADLCWLYFASDRGSGYDVYRSPRQ
jgi:hypothetical protein